jgi:hypothetical protein
LPKCQGLRVIDAKHLDGDTADRRPAYQQRAYPPEASLPVVPSGVEQLDKFSRLRVETRDIRPFKRVAVEASQAQVFGDRLAPVLLRYDVVDFKGKE